MCPGLILVSPFTGLGLLFVVTFAGWLILSGDVGQSVITCYEPTSIFLTLLDEGKMVTFFPPVTN